MAVKSEPAHLTRHLRLVISNSCFLVVQWGPMAQASQAIPFPQICVSTCSSPTINEQRDRGLNPQQQQLFANFLLSDQRSWWSKTAHVPLSAGIPEQFLQTPLAYLHTSICFDGARPFTSHPESVPKRRVCQWSVVPLPECVHVCCRLTSSLDPMQASTHLIPRIELQFSDFKHQQFPVVWLPSMSVTKAQGQTSKGHASAWDHFLSSF